MFIKSLVLLWVVSCGFACYDFDCIADTVFRNLKYLDEKSKYAVGSNASFILTWGASELYIIQQRVKPIQPSHLKTVNKIIDRFDKYVQKAINDNPKDEVIQILYHPETWGLSGNYTFIRGRIPNKGRVDYSLSQIYEMSKATDVDIKCGSDLVDLNKGSESLRLCKGPCDDIMQDISHLETGIAVDERINYLTTEALLNCTNESYEDRLDRVTTFCKYMRSQVNTMFDHVGVAQFDDVRYYFNNKILLCGSYGFSEFYDHDLIHYLLKSVNINGSVGKSDLNLETKYVLTAQTAAILSSVLRMILSGNKVV